ncbi:MAG: hypothetical protein AB8I08_16240 [Sandaracinaceae bacterium]
MSDAPSGPRLSLSPVQILGAVVAVASLVIAFVPTLVFDPGPAPDLFEATERHVRWGLGTGLGAVFVVNRWRRPWSVLIAWIACCVSGGYLLARFVGIALQGVDSPKQWMLVAIEIGICLLAAWWIRRQRDVPDRA